MTQLSDNVQTIAGAVKHVADTLGAIKTAVGHPVATLQHLGLVAVAHGEVFAVVGIVGVLLWLFGLKVGKKVLQWTIAVYALVAILAGAFA